MSDTLADLLGIDLDDPETQRAIQLAEADQELLSTLRAIRKQRGLSQEQVAEMLGVTQPTISAFEAPGNDPRMSTVRRYAQVVGALVRHQVEADNGQLSDHRRTTWIRMDNQEATVAPIIPFGNARPKYALAA